MVHVLIFLQFYHVLSSSRWSWSYLVDTGSPKNILFSIPEMIPSDLTLVIFGLISWFISLCDSIWFISCEMKLRPTSAYTTERDVTGLLGGLATKELPLAPSTQKRWGMVPSLPQSLAMLTHCLIPQFWDTYTFNKQSDSQTQKWTNRFSVVLGCSRHWVPPIFWDDLLPGRYHATSWSSDTTRFVGWISTCVVWRLNPKVFGNPTLTFVA